MYCKAVGMAGEKGGPGGLEALAEKWHRMLVLGVIFMALGAAGLLILPLTTLVSVAVFGAYMVVAGVSQLVHAVRNRGWRSRPLHALLGALYVAGGAATLWNPVLASLVLTLFLGFALVAIGAVRAVVAFQNRWQLPGWRLAVLGGVLSVVLGAIIVASWPWSGLWAVGLFVSIDLVTAGATYVALALAAHRLGERV